MVWETAEDVPIKLSHCFVTLKKIDPKQRYSIFCGCEGERMLVNVNSPTALTDEGMGRVDALLSQESRDELDGHFDVVDPPPGYKEFFLPRELMR